MIGFSWCYAICILCMAVAVISQVTPQKSPLRKVQQSAAEKLQAAKLLLEHADDIDSYGKISIEGSDKDIADLIERATNWCGVTGDHTIYSKLNKFKNTDSCCRKYVQCRDTIPPGEVKYGISNTDEYEYFDCECEVDFKNCLNNFNSSFSKMYYNIHFQEPQKCIILDNPLTCTENPKTCEPDENLEPIWQVITTDYLPDTNL